jgi:hypothetical protein
MGVVLLVSFKNLTPRAHILSDPLLRLLVTISLVEQVLLRVPEHISYLSRFSVVFVLLDLLFSVY